MSRMRTIEQAATHFKACDPATALTKTAIRRLVISGELPCVRVGQKYLLDLDVLEAYLQSGSKPSPVEAAGIRQVAI